MSKSEYKINHSWAMRATHKIIKLQAERFSKLYPTLEFNPPDDNKSNALKIAWRLARLEKKKKNLKKISNKLNSFEDASNIALFFTNLVSMEEKTEFLPFMIAKKEGNNTKLEFQKKEKRTVDLLDLDNNKRLALIQKYKTLTWSYPIFNIII